MANTLGAECSTVQIDTGRWATLGAVRREAVQGVARCVLGEMATGFPRRRLSYAHYAYGDLRRLWR